MPADPVHAPDHPAKAKVFISYSRKDMAFADRLEATLKARGFEPLIDRTEIYAFEDWWQRIQALIGRADTVVFVLSPDAITSDVALKEVAHAAKLNKRFAPIVCRRVDDAAVPEPLRRLNFIFFDEAERFEANADRLADALVTDIDWIRQHTEYGEAARRWVAAGRSNQLLLRSPALETAERWIGSRPHGAPEATADTQALVAESRRGATRRRNILTGSLGAGLVIALGLAALAYWQREIAIEQRQIADQQRKRAEDTLAAATKTANGLVFDLAQRFRDKSGVPAALIQDILGRARGLQQQLMSAGEVPPALKRSEAAGLDETAKSLLAIGDTQGALAAARQSRQIIADLLAHYPDRKDYQRDLSVSDTGLGEVQMALGDLPGALQTYHDGLALADRLARSDPANAGWQRDLSVAYEMVGKVQKAQGDLRGALESYRVALAITDRLARSDPGNAGWQRDLSVAHDEIGDIEADQNDFVGALASYRATLAIAARLANSDAGNARWQHDLSGAYTKIGNVQSDQDDLAGALKSYRDGLAIMDRLANSDRGNAGWQRDLSVIHEKVGYVLLQQHDLAGALTSYRASLGLIERLARSDPHNLVWQRDLSVSYINVGDVQKDQDDLPGALESFRQGSAIFDRLAKADPSNVESQRDLSKSLMRIGEVQAAQGDRLGALRSYRDSLAIVVRLLHADPGNARWQQDLILLFMNIAEAEPSKARDMLSRALEIAKNMQAKGILAPNDAWLVDDLAKRIAALPQ